MRMRCKARFFCKVSFALWGNATVLFIVAAVFYLRWRSGAILLSIRISHNNITSIFCSFFTWLLWKVTWVYFCCHFVMFAFAWYTAHDTFYDVKILLCCFLGDTGINVMMTACAGDYENCRNEADIEASLPPKWYVLNDVQNRKFLWRCWTWLCHVRRFKNAQCSFFTIDEKV